MPLISDSKKIFVGTTPITTVLAGEDVVWCDEKLTDIQFYYGTTNPDFDKSASLGGTPAIYASWVTNQRPENCSDILGQFGIQHTFDKISNAAPSWTLEKWDDAGWRAIPASTPGLMVMQAHGNMYPYDTRFRLSRNATSINYPEVYSEEFRVGAFGSTDPAYTLYTDLPKLPFEWLAESGCSPPLIVPKPATVVWNAIKFNVIWFDLMLHQSEWNSCAGMKENFEYRIRFPDNTYSDWLPFIGWVAPATFGPTDRKCRVWALYIASSAFPSPGSRMTAYFRETTGERSFTASYMSQNDPEVNLVNVGITLTCN